MLLYLKKNNFFKPIPTAKNDLKFSFLFSQCNDC
jgi:hypothetical protein